MSATGSQASFFFDEIVENDSGGGRFCEFENGFWIIFVTFASVQNYHIFVRMLNSLKYS